MSLSLSKMPVDRVRTLMSDRTPRTSADVAAELDVPQYEASIILSHLHRNGYHLAKVGRRGGGFCAGRPFVVWQWRGKPFAGGRA